MMILGKNLFRHADLKDIEVSLYCTIRYTYRSSLFSHACPETADICVEVLDDGQGVRHLRRRQWKDDSNARRHFCDGKL